MSESFIYFVRCGDYVKIGRAQWPEYRMKFLAIASPHPMSLIAKFPGHAQTERAVHQAVKQHRHRGEWFHWHPDIERLIATELRDLFPWKAAEKSGRSGTQGGAAHPDRPATAHVGGQ